MDPEKELEEHNKRMEKSEKKTKALMKFLFPPEPATKEDLEKIFNKNLDVSATKANNKDGAPSVHEIYYHNETGVGYNNGKRFVFKNHQPEFRVFGEMYKHINHPISRQKVLEIGGCQETLKETETYFINDLAKKMRTRTGLDINQIVNNNGCLTLVGKKNRLNHT